MRYRVDHRAIGYGAITGPAKVIDAFTGRAMATFEDWQDADEYVALMNAGHESLTNPPPVSKWALPKTRKEWP